jgi:transcriptional regulator with XRE-family HTH domain
VTVGERIRNKREELGMTMESLGNSIGAETLHSQSISGYCIQDRYLKLYISVHKCT